LTKGENCNSGISLPKTVMARIDSVKHPDIPRSKFVLRILEAALIQKEKESEKK
jgi:metal-responsive CopG/Arc/MetJ family transcriptional regulator